MYHKCFTRSLEFFLIKNADYASMQRRRSESGGGHYNIVPETKNKQKKTESKRVSH